MSMKNKYKYMTNLIKNIRNIAGCSMLAIFLVAGNSSAIEPARQLDQKIQKIGNVLAEKDSKDKLQPELSVKYNQEDIQKTIDDASSDAKKNAKNAQESFIKASEIAKKTNSKELARLAQNKADIEKSRKEIAKLQLLFTKDLEKTNKELGKISDSLKKAENRYLGKYLSRSELKLLYKEVVSYWRVLTDSSLKVFSQKSYIEVEKYHPDKLFYEISGDITDQNLIEQRDASYHLLETEYKNILSLKNQWPPKICNFNNNLNPYTNTNT